jgi:protein transport protein SEC61 subunit alpha
VKHWLPEVDGSVKRIDFRDKLLWTAATLVIYLICCQLPLYGVQRLNGMDPLY